MYVCMVQLQNIHSFSIACINDSQIAPPCSNTSIHIYGTAQFKLYTHMLVHTCACTFTLCKIVNVVCIFFVACGFVVHTCSN